MRPVARAARRDRPLGRVLVGLGLVAFFWWRSWHPERLAPLEPISFFGLWLGYVLAVDGLTARRTGTSPFARGPAGWLGLFAVSAPAWWLFEFLNRFLGNWEYLGTAHYGPVAYTVYASLSFSTVVPAVFTTAELLASLGLPRRFARGPVVADAPATLARWMLAGFVLLGGVVVLPRYFFPATWLAVFFVLDPINHLAGRPAVAARVRQGDWRLVVLLGGAALVCGFFWELWNWRASPKWIYHVPFVGSLRLFEMPLAGYLGYVPFGLELYALTHFLAAAAGASVADLPLGDVPGGRDPDRDRVAAAGAGW